jgi:hypothetical protein
MNKTKFRSLDDYLIDINKTIQELGSNNNNQGLMHGNVGLSVYFYHLYQSTNNPEYERIADNLLDKVFSNLTSFLSTDFENGLAGIGWGIEYLVQNGFAEGNTNEILEEIDNKIFKTLHENNIQSFELTNGFAGYLFYLIYRLKNSRKTDIATHHINQRLIILIINKLDTLVGKQMQCIVNGMNFDLFWRFPIILYGLAEAFKLNIYNEKIEHMLKQWSCSLQNYLPSLHINRLYIATSLSMIDKLIPQIGLKKQIQTLLFATDFKILCAEINVKLLNIRYGGIGAELILFVSTQIIPKTDPKYPSICSAYEEMAKRNEFALKSFQPSKQSGINVSLSDGIAGVGLFRLLLGNNRSIV